MIRPVKIKAPKTPADLIFRPFRNFAKQEASGGIVLIIATVIALVLANSPWAEHYHGIWETTFTVRIGEYELSKHLIHWINDGLMTVFFFVVGLEIKREVLIGELSTLRKSTLPIAAALGGMLVPAGIYAAFNAGGEGADGWGVPMATDIAFALGILALLGKRAPISLKIFLTALAIIDDIGAVMVIAIFYTEQISLVAFAGAGVVLVLLMIANRLHMRSPIIYLFLGAFLWFALLKSGLHATIAGILLAMTVPAQARINSKEYVGQGEELLKRLKGIGVSEAIEPANEAQLGVIRGIKKLSQHLESPLQRLEHAHHYVTTYLIIPVFALANAGVSLDFEMSAVTHPVTLGIFFGLTAGKVIGVAFFSWLAVRAGIAELPASVRWRHIIGVGCLSGIGFTMSLFITNLAFVQDNLMQMSKLAILGASLLAGVIGFVILSRCVEVEEEEEEVPAVTRV